MFKIFLHDAFGRHFAQSKNINSQKNSTNKKNVFNILETKMFSSSFMCQKVQPFLG